MFTTDVVIEELKFYESKCNNVSVLESMVESFMNIPDEIQEEVPFM